MCDNALEEWKSMCTEEVEKIWQTEGPELRRAVMVFHVLRQEFDRIEYDLGCKLQKLKEDNSTAFAELKSPLTPELFHIEPLQVQVNDKKEEETQLIKTQKVNKHRITRPKRSPTSPSIDIQKTNGNQLKSMVRTYHKEVGTRNYKNYDEEVLKSALKEKNATFLAFM